MNIVGDGGSWSWRGDDPSLSVSTYPAETSRPDPFSRVLSVKPQAIRAVAGGGLRKLDPEARERRRSLFLVGAPQRPIPQHNTVDEPTSAPRAT